MQNSTVTPLGGAVQAADDMPGVSRAAARAPKSKTRVLVMDDDLAIRSLVQAMLREQGYHVNVAKSGAEAVKRFRQALDDGKPFDTVILDLVVPSGGDGESALDEIRRMAPRVQAILMTGAIEHPMVSSYEDAGFHAALIKPFTGSELIQALHWAADALSGR